MRFLEAAVVAIAFQWALVGMPGCTAGVADPIPCETDLGCELAELNTRCGGLEDGAYDACVQTVNAEIARGGK